eukprot:212212_1
MNTLDLGIFICSVVCAVLWSIPIGFFYSFRDELLIKGRAPKLSVVEQITIVVNFLWIGIIGILPRSGCTVANSIQTVLLGIMTDVVHVRTFVLFFSIRQINVRQPSLFEIMQSLQVDDASVTKSHSPTNVENAMENRKRSRCSAIFESRSRQNWFLRNKHLVKPTNLALFLAASALARIALSAPFVSSQDLTAYQCSRNLADTIVLLVTFVFSIMFLVFIQIKTIELSDSIKLHSEMQWFCAIYAIFCATLVGFDIAVASQSVSLRVCALMLFQVMLGLLNYRPLWHRRQSLLRTQVQNAADSQLNVKKDSYIDLSLRDVMKSNPAVLEEFRRFLERSFAPESLAFCEDVARFKEMFSSSSDEDHLLMFEAIREKFIGQDAWNEVNLQHRMVQTLQSISDKIMDDSISDVDQTVFDEAEAEIFKIMNEGHYQRFKRQSQSNS